jgi:hypothetical protein
MITAMLVLLIGMSSLVLMCCLGLLTLRRLVARPTEIYYSQYVVWERARRASGPR